MGNERTTWRDWLLLALGLMVVAGLVVFVLRHPCPPGAYGLFCREPPSVP